MDASATTVFFLMFFRLRRLRQKAASSPESVDVSPTGASKLVGYSPALMTDATEDGPLCIAARRSTRVLVAVDDLGGRLSNRTVVGFRVDSTDGGYLYDPDADVIEQAAETARLHRRPLVGVLGSGGVEVSGGLAALHAWGRAARAVGRCSGLVPVVLVVDGPAVSATALLLGLADIVIMTSGSYAFVSGPKMVAEMTGVELDAEALGGSAALARSSGVAWMVAADVDEALDTAASLLDYLPDHADLEPTQIATGLTLAEVEAPVAELDSIIPAVSTGSYDVRKIIGACCDDESVLEVRARWAPNLVTAFARIDGRSVGIVANQPLSIAGTLDIPAAQKGAAFVSFCDAFNVPIITFVDTPGYFPGKDLEWRGMIRHGAQMAYAYAEATVPRICVVTRKAYGGAYIVMDSRTMGSDLVLAWPSAELAVMGAKGAVQILFRRESEAERAERELEYADNYLNPYVAAERGLVDRVIAPHETRRDLVRALSMLSTKRENLRPKVHGNTPL